MLDFVLFFRLIARATRPMYVLCVLILYLYTDSILYYRLGQPLTIYATVCMPYVCRMYAVCTPLWAAGAPCASHPPCTPRCVPCHTTHAYTEYLQWHVHASTTDNHPPTRPAMALSATNIARVPTDTSVCMVCRHRWPTFNRDSFMRPFGSDFISSRA